MTNWLSWQSRFLPIWLWHALFDGTRICRCAHSKEYRPHTFIFVVHYPYRGSDVEAWIKRFRDTCSPLGDDWHALDWLLDDYRLHADTGTKLESEVIERG